MEGYKIVFKSSSGIVSDTFMGLPISSFFDDGDLTDQQSRDIISMFFYQAYPGYSIVSMEKCFLSDV